MAFREKSAWIAVLASLPIWGFYFWSVVSEALEGRLDGDMLFWRFLICLGVAVAVMLPLNIAAALLGRQDMDARPDEREAAIDARANRIGLALLEALGLGLVLASGALSGFARDAYPADPAGAATLVLVNALLFCLVLAACTREALQIVQFRMMD